jgi:hypothetical protein
MVLGEKVDALRADVAGAAAALAFAPSPEGANNDAALDLLFFAASAAELTRLLSALSPPKAAMAPN